MVEIVFLDTNVMLDYLENRNTQVGKLVAQLLLFHRREKIVLATSIFNIAELIDKEFQIYFIGKLLNERLSFDEIQRKKGDYGMFRKVADKNKENIKRKIREFVFGERIEVLIPFLRVDYSEEEKEYEEVYKMIYEHQFSSQDALMIATAIIHRVTYFLSNDWDVVKQIRDNNLMYAYSLRDIAQREDFSNNVLDNLLEELK